MAGYLGVGITVDAFAPRYAFRTCCRIFSAREPSASFIPVYSKLLGRDDAAAGRLAGAVAGLLALVAGLVAVVGVVFARGLTSVLTPGYSGERLRLTVTLVRILTPGTAFLVLSAWCLGVLNSHRRFFLPYVAPVLWNMAQIAVLVGAGLWGLGQSSMAVALAWGAFAGGLIQFGVQLPAVISVSRSLRLSLRTDIPGVRSVVRQFVPVVVGRGVVQLSGYAELLLASLLAVGAVAALGYAQIFYLLPISLFGMSVAAAELPELSRLESSDRELLGVRLQEGLRRIAFSCFRPWLVTSSSVTSWSGPCWRAAVSVQTRPVWSGMSSLPTPAHCRRPPLPASCRVLRTHQATPALQLRWPPYECCSWSGPVSCSCSSSTAW